MRTMPDAVSIRTTRRRCLLVHVRPNAVQVVDERGELGFVQRTTKGVIQGIYAIIEGLDQREALVGDLVEGGLYLTGLAAEQTLRCVLAYQHFAGAARQDIKAATNLIEREGQTQLVGLLLRSSNQLGDMPPVGAIALEVAANEARENRLLRLQMGSLEQYWREAEALASIVDGELIWMSGVERMRLRGVGGL